MAETMSYKIDLSDLERDGDVSLTQQLVDRFAAAIEAGELEPGEKLPPTAPLADGRGRQPPDRRARVPQAGRARLRDARASGAARSCARSRRAGSAERGDDWQVYVLPDRRRSPTRRRCSPTPSGCRASPGMISLATGLPSPAALPRRGAGADRRRGVRRGGRRRARLPHGRGAVPAARADRAARAATASRPSRGDHRDLGRAQQALDLVGRALLEPGRRGGDRVADASSGCSRRCAPPARA